MAAYTGVMNIGTATSENLEDWLNQIETLFDTIPIISLVEKNYTSPTSKFIKFQIGDSEHYLVFNSTNDSGGRYWTYAENIAHDAILNNWHNVAATMNNVSFYVIASLNIFILKIDDHVIVYAKTTAGKWYIIGTDCIAAFDAETDSTTFSILKPYYTHKDSAGNYLCVPAKILNTGLNQVVDDTFISVFSVLGFPTNDAFYTLSDGKKAYYKANLLCTD